MHTVSQTPAVRKPRTRKPVPRFVRVSAAPTPALPAIIEIRVGEGARAQVDDYHVRRIPSDFGQAFELVKMDGQDTTYHVLLEEDGRTCDCKGFIRWGHCKHADCVLKLVQLGKL